MTTANTAARAATKDVAPGYRHVDKFIEPDDNLETKGTNFKWHNLALADKPVPAGVRGLARDFIGRESAAGKLETLGDLGFVILHRCGEEFYFLIVNSWRNENELWETVYAKKSDAEADFEEFTPAIPHRGAFCVWELVAVWHEQQAWRRFLLSARDAEARGAYLDDHYRGPA